MIKSVIFIDNLLLKCITTDAVVRGTYKRISISIIIIIIICTTCPAVHGGDGTSCHEAVVPVFPLYLCSSVPLSPIDTRQAAEGGRERERKERETERERERERKRERRGESIKMLLYRMYNDT